MPRRTPPAGGMAAMQQEMLDGWLAANAALPEPLPVCTGCGVPYETKDAGFIIADQCGSCELAHIEDLVRDLVSAGDRPSTLRALGAITRLAM